RGYAQLNRWEEALSTLQKAADAGPEYRYYLASARASNRQLDEAEKLLTDLLEEPDWKPRARRQLGHVKLLQGDHARATELYSSENGEQASSFDLGRAALIADDPKTARTHFQKALEENAKDEATRFALAYASAELGDTGELEALADETSVVALEELANRAFDSRRYVEALEAYERAIRKSTSVSTEVLCRLAICVAMS
ncbi:MAG: tetratricopeptide repeat protein, partial [Planctomycetota bacterium]